MAEECRPPLTTDARFVNGVLGLCRRLRAFYAFFGVAYPVFEVLLRARLIEDLRGRQKGAGSDAEAQVTQGLGFTILVMVYVHVGVLFAAAAFLVPESPFGYGTAASALIMILVTFPLVTDGTHLLMDSRDFRVVATLPVSGRTLVFLKVTHVGLYLVFLWTLLAVPLILIAPFAFPAPGLSALALGLLAVSSGAAGVGFTAAFFMLALRFGTPGRYKSRVVGLQVGLTGVLLAGYLWVVQGAGREKALAFLGAHPGAWDFIPWAWSGALLRWAQGMGMASDPLRAVAVALLPVLGLLALAGVARGVMLGRWIEGDRVGGGSRPLPRSTWAVRLGKRLCRRGAERAGCLFLLTQQSVDSAFKARVAPQLVPPVIIFASLINEVGWAQVIPGAIYVTLLVFFVASLASRFSEDAHGRWIFDRLEPEVREAFVRGARVGGLCRFVLLPAMFFLVGVGVSLPPGRWMEALYALGVSLSGSFLLALAVVREIPFARPLDPQRNAMDDFGLFLGLFTVIGLVGGVHVALTFVPGPVFQWLALPTMALAWWLWRRLAWPRGDVEEQVRA